MDMEFGAGHKHLDDDGLPRRTGTLLTASAHIITAVIGAGVLSLSWAIAQLGWVAGTVALAVFSVITWYTSVLLADAYRSPDPTTGGRNCTYMGAVSSILGGAKVQICGLVQYANCVAITIAFIVAGSISMDAVHRSNCFHAEGTKDKHKCPASNYWYMTVFGVLQIVLSQIPNFHKLSIVSIIAAIMSFSYSLIGIGLSITRIAEGSRGERMTVEGAMVKSHAEKLWLIFQALGDIAAAYSYSLVLVEIQDTLKTSPPENQVMKKATSLGISTTTVFYMLCGLLGYAAFGNDAPGNFLTGFGFYEPFWIIDIGNVCIAIHLIGAYQLYCQPVFQYVETRCSARWPKSDFLNKEYRLGDNYSLNLFRLVWRTGYVVATTVVSMAIPFFNIILGLIGALSFWPLTVYFPVEMHIKQARVQRWSAKWVALQLLSLGCLIISLLAAIGAVQGLVQGVQDFRPFHPKRA